MSLYIKTNETEQYTQKLSYGYMKSWCMAGQVLYISEKNMYYWKMCQTTGYPYIKSTLLPHTTYKY